MVQRLFYLLSEYKGRRGLRWRDSFMVLDEVRQVAVFLFAYGSFQRKRLGGDTNYLGDPFHRHIQGTGDLIDGRLSSQFLKKLAARLDETVDRLNHVDRNSN